MVDVDEPGDAAAGDVALISGIDVNVGTPDEAARTGVTNATRQDTANAPHAARMPRALDQKFRQTMLNHITLYDYCAGAAAAGASLLNRISGARDTAASSSTPKLALGE